MIETARLRLRPWRPDERPSFAALVNPQAMTRHLGGIADPARLDTLFRRRLDDQARHGFSYWAVEERDGGRLVGTCGVRRPEFDFHHLRHAADNAVGATLVCTIGRPS